jgi:transposase
MPVVGPISALAIDTIAPPMEQFRRGRDFAAWLGRGGSVCLNTVRGVSK